MKEKRQNKGSINLSSEYTRNTKKLSLTKGIRGH